MRQPAQPDRVERGSSRPSRQGAARRDPVADTEHLLAILSVGTPKRCAARLAATAERTASAGSSL